MLLTAFAIFILVLIIDAAHYASLFGFLHRMHRKAWHVPERPFEPKTAVILTLRGADPFLNRCVEGLMKQDYRNFTLFFVVDHETDPALPIVRELMARNRDAGPECQLVIVREHLKTCALKCNSLVHVVKTLDASWEVVVTVDADTTPRPNWLRELVEPLSDSRFAVTSGLRWYVPDRNNFGSLIRMLWNIAAVNQMAFSQIPWGGSLAIRRDVFEKGQLLETWKRTFTDDVPIFAVVRKMGARTIVTPSLLMVNREVCTLRAFYPWVKRQVLYARLYHPAWGLVLGQAFFLTAPLIAAFGLGVYALGASLPSVAAWSFGAIAAYVLGVLGALLIMDGDVRRYLRGQGEFIPAQTFGFAVKTMFAIALTQAVYSFAILGIYRMKKVLWRGVWYAIDARKNVQMIEYVPYVELQEKDPVLTRNKASIG